METEKKTRKPREKKVVAESATTESVPEKKKLGRPKKVVAEPQTQTQTPAQSEPAKKKGRPKKVTQAESQTTQPITHEDVPTKEQTETHKEQTPETAEESTNESKIETAVAEEEKKKPTNLDDDDDEEPTIEDYKTLLRHYIEKYSELQRKMSKYTMQVDMLMEDSWGELQKYYMESRSIKKTAKRYCMEPVDVFDLVCLCDGNDLIASTARDYKEVMQPIRPELFAPIH